MTSLWLQAWQRETTLLRTQVQHWALPVCFAVIVLLMLQFALDTQSILNLVLPRMITVIVMLVMFMVPEYLFKSDWQSGYLQQYALSPLGLNTTVAIRLCVQAVWLGVPLLGVMMLATSLLSLPAAVIHALLLSMMALIPTVFLLSAFAGALTLALPESSLLGVVILLPFYCPPLILSQAMILRAQEALPFWSEWYLLMAMMVVSVILLPWLMVVLLRKALG